MSTYLEERLQFNFIIYFATNRDQHPGGGGGGRTRECRINLYYATLLIVMTIFQMEPCQSDCCPNYLVYLVCHRLSSTF
jgi:hypothetical protein